MGTNKERIEQLEVGRGGVQDKLDSMEQGMSDKLQHLEETINRLANIMLVNQEQPNHHNQPRDGQEGGRMVVSSKTARLEFPWFSGDDPTEWFNRVN